MNNIKSRVGNAGKGGVKAVGGVFSDFKTFIDKGNVVDLAVGIILGGAFTSIVTSLVVDIFTPIIGLAGGAQLKDSFAYLKEPTICRVNKEDPNCLALKVTLNTPEDAVKAGAVTINWGRFVQTTINFIIIAIIMFFVIKAYTASFRRKKADPTERECPMCIKMISVKAIKCSFCCERIPKGNVLDLEGGGESNPDKTF